ncbi:MAG: TolC family protein [Candidatus Aminicenantes bacterium]|nr:TolC family protein [Candidatus Aminicenantes bacterium]
MLNKNTTAKIKSRRVKIFSYIGLSVLFFCWLKSFSGAQETTKFFSLKEARTYALQHNYDVKKSLLDLETAKTKLKETVASGLPQLSSTINYNNNLKLATSLIPNFFDGKPEEKIPVQFGTQHNASANLTVQQLVFSGSYFVGLQTAAIYRQMAEQGLEVKNLDIEKTITDTYFLILVSKENEKILGANLKNLEKTQFEIKERNREGFVAQTDVDLIQISVTTLKNGLQTAQKQSEIAYKLLKFQMGLELEEKIELTDTLETIENALDIQKSLETEFSLEDSLDYNFLVTQEKLAELALKNEKVKSLPTVAAFFTYQQNAFRDSFNFFNLNKKWFPLQILGLTVSIPLFTSGAQKARVQQAALALEKAKTTRMQVSQGLKLEIQQAKINLNSSYENYLNVKANMELSERVYNSTLVEYKEGMASSMELTHSYDKYLAAQSQYVQALSTLFKAKNQLDRITNNYSTEKGRE